MSSAMIVKLARQNHTHAQNAFLRTYDSTETLIGYSKAIEFIRDRPLLKNARYFSAKQPGNSKKQRTRSIHAFDHALHEPAEPDGAQ